MHLIVRGLVIIGFHLDSLGRRSVVIGASKRIIRLVIFVIVRHFLDGSFNPVLVLVRT